MTAQLQQGQRLGLSGSAMRVWLQCARLARRYVGFEASLARPVVVVLDDMMASDLFAEAVRENSNLELDWLWLAGRLDSHAERRYCFQRVLEINPGCERARRALGSK